MTLVLYGDKWFVSCVFAIQKQHQAYYGNILSFPDKFCDTIL